MEDLIKEMGEVMDVIKGDIHKGTKAAEARVRKGTLEFAKLGKRYRKESIAQHQK